jgi:FkbM family methyltransferase
MEINSKGTGNMIYEIPDTNISFDLRSKYPTDEIVLREIWEENVYEVADWRFNRGGVVVDLGANIGAFSVYAAHKGAEVYAVEPEPNNLKALKKNILLNDMQEKIHILPYAVTDYKGIAVINNKGGDSTILDDKPGTEVEAMAFNQMFDLYNLQSVDVLKIDVEGSEVEIILSASKENLEKCKYITMEFDLRTGSRMGDLVKKLSETHHVRTMGSWERGGMIWAWLY